RQPVGIAAQSASDIERAPTDPGREESSGIPRRQVDVRQNCVERMSCSGKDLRPIVGGGHARRVRALRGQLVEEIQKLVDPADPHPGIRSCEMLRREDRLLAQQGAGLSLYGSKRVLPLLIPICCMNYLMGILLREGHY